jgi:hypothetical protein
MWSSVVVSLFAGVIVIHADPSTGAAGAYQEGVIRDLASLLAARGRASLKIDRDLLGAGCSASPACVKAIFERTSADDVVILEFTRIMGRVRIAADRFKGAAWQKMHAPELELASDSKDWKVAIEERLLPHLFPELQGWSEPKASSSPRGTPSKAKSRVVGPAPLPRTTRADVVQGRSDGDLGDDSASRPRRQVIKPIDDDLPPDLPERD